MSSSSGSVRGVVSSLTNGCEVAGCCRELAGGGIDGGEGCGVRSNDAMFDVLGLHPAESDRRDLATQC